MIIDLDTFISANRHTPRFAANARERLGHRIGLAEADRVLAAEWAIASRCRTFRAYLAATTARATLDQGALALVYAAARAHPRSRAA